MCFRDADGAGHAHGSTEPHVYHELDGALHKTGHLLAAAGQPEGKVTNGLLSALDACKTHNNRAASSPPCLYFTTA